jgi:hypothetical protein
MPEIILEPCNEAIGGGEGEISKKELLTSVKEE